MRHLVTVILAVALLTGCGGGSGPVEPKPTAASKPAVAELPFSCTIVTGDDIHDALDLDYLGTESDRGCEFAPPGGGLGKWDDVLIYVQFDRLREGGPTFADSRETETHELDSQSVTEPKGLGDEAWINVGKITGLDPVQSRAGARVGDVRIRVGLDQRRDNISEKGLRAVTETILALAVLKAVQYDES